MKKLLNTFQQVSLCFTYANCPLCTSCETLSKLLHVLVPLYLHLYNGVLTVAPLQGGCEDQKVMATVY